MAGSINLANVAIGFDSSQLTRGVDLSAGELRKLTGIVSSSVAPVDRYAEEMSILQVAFEKGALSAERFAAAQDHLAKKHGVETYAMIEQRQAAEALAKRKSEADALEKVFRADTERGIHLRNQVATAEERHANTIREHNEDLRKGIITRETYNRLISQSQQNNFGLQIGKWDSAVASISHGMIAVNQGLEIGSKAIGVFKSGFAAFIEEADRIDKLDEAASKLGMSYNDLVTARRAFGEISGAESSDIDSSMQKMQVNLVDARQGTSDLAKSLKTLGLDPETLAKMMPIDAVKAVSDELHKMPAPAEQLKLSMDLFGKSGAAMVTVLRGGVAPIQDMQNHLKATGLLMDDSAVSAISTMNDRFERMRDHLQGVANFVTADLAKAFLGVDNTIDSMLNKMSKIKTPEQQAANKEALSKGLMLGAAGVLGGLQSMQLYQEMASRGQEIADQQAEIDKTKREEEKLTEQLNAKNQALLDKYTSQREQLQSKLGLLKDGAAISAYDAAIRAGFSEAQAKELFQLSEAIKAEEKRTKIIKDRADEVKRMAEETKRDKLKEIDEIVEHGPNRLEQEFKNTLRRLDEFAQAGAINQKEYDKGLNLAAQKFQDDRNKRDNPNSISSTIAPAIKAGSVEAYKYMLSQREKAEQHAQRQTILQERLVEFAEEQVKEIKEVGKRQVLVAKGRG